MVNLYYMLHCSSEQESNSEDDTANVQKTEVRTSDHQAYNTLIK